MSFALTTAQIFARTKSVTRRLGWENLKPGQYVGAAEKGMGLRKGEKVNRLATIRAVQVTRERLDAIDQADVIREGFPDMAPMEFVAMFCDHNKAKKCRPSTIVTRIEFEYVDAEGEPHA